MQEALMELEHLLLERGSGEIASKARQLLDKWNRGKWYVAFCGHFSAGKSTLLNKLCGAPLLPSSPIPTSANLVSIHNGEKKAIIRYRPQWGKNGDHPPVQTIPLHRLAEFCKNGEEIETVELYTPVPFLGKDAVMLDTPGIDSTDEAHLRATESALHLADVVFYVMDYNHVLSEINFAFTKRLKESGKPLYLVVNQIDKHREEELPFETYRAKVKESFSQWGIAYADIFFISLKDMSVPGNEWDRLVWTLGELVSNLDRLRRGTTVQSGLQIIEEFGRLLREKRERAQAEYFSRFPHAEDPLREAEELRRHLEALALVPAQTEAKLKKEIADLLENANLTPALTRDLAHRYLESRQPGFKAGFWFSSASRTKREKEERLQAFLDDLQKQIQAHIDWHLQSLFRTFCEQWSLDGGAEAVTEPLSFRVTEDWLNGRVRSAVVISGEYTLNFCKEIAEEIKTYYRKQTSVWIKGVKQTVAKRTEQEAAACRKRLDALSPALEAKERLLKLEREEAEILSRMRSLFGGETVSVPSLLPDPSRYVRENRQTQEKGQTWSETAASSAKARPPVIHTDAGACESFHTQTSSPLAENWRKQIQAAAEMLEKGGQILEGVPSMTSAAESMRQRAERLRKNRFTIALFGAFSAGKSSFANALLGENVLPVSPNPTTASINRILPPDGEWEHGSAKVAFKTSAQLLDDVKYSLAYMGYSAETMEEALHQIQKLEEASIPEKGKPHAAFLKAVAQGYGEARDKLGSVWKADLAQFHAYVSEESRSAFVDHMELYYANPLTEQGIVLVDTPGADSINARHTGVAFNYIKNADAVIFVTYYNHAFSQADREFLRQLGRVKESFEMDKMFFVVNAADLASAREELDEVLQYVESNLIKFGIRQPRLYPVSSKWALQAKMERDEQVLAQSGLAKFERDFNQFTFGELAQLAVESAQTELLRAADTLRELLDTARKDNVQREKEAARLRSGLEQMLARMEELKERMDLGLVEKEVDELLYYVNQRMLFRFGEWYNAAFHPSVLREDGRNLTQALRIALNELTRFISSALSQEVLATTLRVERFLEAEAAKLRESWASALASEFSGYTLADDGPALWSTPEVKETLEGISVGDAWLKDRFKNAKTFFEGGGKEKLREQLEAQFQPLIRDYLHHHGELLKSHYKRKFREILEILLHIEKRSLSEFAAGALEVLEMKVDLNEIQGKIDALRSAVS